MSTDLQRRRVLRRVLLALAAAVMLAQVGEVFEELELPTVDARFVARGTQPAPPAVAVVGVDRVTLDEVGATWPFGLELHARAVRELTAAGAAVIVLDVPFGPTDGPGAEDLRTALEAAGPVVLGTVQASSDGTPIVLGGPDALAVAGVRAGDARFDADDDGVVRRFDHTLRPSDDDEAGSDTVPTTGVPTIAVVAVELATGIELPIDVTGPEGATIDVPGPTGTVDQVSFLSLVNGRVPAGDLAGRVVVVGPTAPSLQDLVPTALAERTSGAEVHAAAIATLLDDLPLRTPGPAGQLALILLACMAPLAAARFAPSRGVLVVVAAALLWLVVAQVAFGAGLVLPVVAPLTGLVGAAAAAVGVNYAFETRARRRVREVFGRFVPPEVVRDIVDADAAGDGDLLRAATREVTVLFADLRGFTTYAEARPADEVLRVLNAYLGAVTDVLVDEGGAVVDYLGDGVMAVFGAPTPQEDHADRALAAAVRVLEVTAAFDVSAAAGTAPAGVGAPPMRFRVGVGCNSGTVTAGNLGTIRRLKYTVVGDTVNTASRVESLTKDAPFDLLLTDATRTRLRVPPDDLVEHATMPVRGRSAPVRLWSLARAASVPAPVAGTTTTVGDEPTADRGPRDGR
jgi:adenylate cyclase